MLADALFGAGFAFAAAVQPGPLLAFLLARVAERGWRHTLPAALSPLLSDGPIALLALLVLSRLPEGARRALQAAGGALLLALAGAALRRWRRPADRVGSAPGPPRTLLQATAVNAANPGPYLGWTLVLGPAAMRAWRAGPAHAVALVGAFYVAMVATLAALVVGFGATGLLSARARRVLVLLSAVALAVLGAVQLAGGLRPA